MIVLAIWNCFYIPFEIAFTPEDSIIITILDYLIDALFVVDIAINFRSTFVNKNGEEIYDGKKIAKKYALGGRFWIDFLSVVPFELMSGGVKSLNLFGLLKLVRITRLNIILNKLDL